MSPTPTQTATVALADLVEPATNPNHMTPESFESLRLVIRERGFFQPPLVRVLGDGRMEIVDGVHRVRAAKAEGLTEVTAVLVTVDDVTARMLQVSMNRLRGELDFTQVAATVRALVDAGVSDDTLRLIGYPDDDLRAMVEATKVHSAEDVLGDTTGSFLDEEPEEEKRPKPFLLELTFQTAAELRKVKRVLKKAGSGDHAAGLLSLIDGA